jgi:hypothetical protein
MRFETIAIHAGDRPDAGNRRHLSAYLSDINIRV